MKKWFLIFLLSFIPFGAGSLYGEHESYPQKENLEYLRQAEKEINGDFFLEGVVVDQRGNPLKEVKLEISTYYSSWADWNPFLEKRYKQNKIINGTFSLRIRNRASVHLRFYKEGYYPEELYFSFEPPEGGIREGRSLVNKNIQVILEKIGGLPKLVRYDSYLRYYSGGRAVIIDLEKGLNDDMDAKRGIVEVKDILTAINMNLLPRNSIYLVPLPEGMDTRGRIIPVDRGPRHTPYARRAKIVTPDPEGGFLIYKPKKKWRFYFDPLIREMKEAPEYGKGYVKEIILLGEGEKAPQGRDIFFYFYIGGRYGKGYVSSWVSYKRPNKRENLPEGVGVGITLWLNPTGERNVRTESLYY